MFTGIVEEIGRIRRVSPRRLEIAAPRLSGSVRLGDNVRQGDSVAVNGVCLTASGAAGEILFFDVMPLTIRDTTLALLSSGAAVNLERAVPADGRLGGHFVSGHVDEAGVVERMDGRILWLKAGAANKIYLTRKGSVAVDGVSLTIQEIEDSSFAVSLVEHTQRTTTLSALRRGDKVNLEYDILMRYVQNILAAAKPARRSLLRKF